MTNRKHNELGGLPPPGQKTNRTPIRDREDRDRIEFDLATGKSIRQLANKYGVHEQSLYKHRKSLPPQLKAAFLGRLLKPNVDLDKLRTEESEGLLQSLAMQRARLLLQQDKAMEDGDGALVATLSRAIHDNLRLVGTYLGELTSHSTQHVINVLLTPEYLQLRNALIRALAPYKEARQAVAATLHEMESGAASRTPQPRIIDVTPALPAPEQTNEQG
jgi:transposase-like protein